MSARSAVPVPAAPFAVRARLASLTTGERAILLDRGRAADPAVQAAVRALIDDVRARGDDALREMALRFDNAPLDALEVPAATCRRALERLDPAVRAALEQAARNIETFHRAQLPTDIEIETAPGVRLGRRAEPLRSVGVYAPGGRAAYPSSVLMGVVPARVAGVGSVIVCSPPGPDGLPPAAVLAACALAGADRVFALGGAGAIAAMALGTATVPRVDRIVGPGNAFVTEAKQQLTGSVAIDSPAGPSEVLIIADDTADAALIAAELLAQAEHDPDAAAVLVTTAPLLADAVEQAIAHMLPTQPRADIMRAALAARGALLVADDIAAACAFAADYAPEHLLVLTAEPRALLPQLSAAGTIFLGAPSSVAFGDYITGANHVLPTAGLARSYAGLSTADFLRFATYQELTPAAAASLAAPTVALATAEGLPAHAEAARLRAAGPAPDAQVTAPARSSRVMRSAYRALAPYDPGRVPCAIDLSDNTNLFGPAPSVRHTLATLPDATITRYPTVYATELRALLAELHDVAPENISTGCGSDDVIDSAMRAFCDANDIVAYPEPTFGMVPAFARMNAALPRAVPLSAGFALDAEALLAARSRLIYICRPNNPTGTQFDRAAAERVCREAAGLVLIDEAYADFAPDDMVQLAAGGDGAVVLRTLSKAYGLAGMRIGYAVGPAPLIAEIEKSRGPYKVSGPAEAVACAVLRGDGQWVRERAMEARASRDRLLVELRSRGVTAFDSAANFVLLQVDGSAQDWNARLRARGVAVRPFSALPGAGECLRVSAGPWPMVQAFLDAFDEVRNDVNGWMP
jgi:histidinol dehydrogenase